MYKNPHQLGFCHWLFFSINLWQNPHQLVQFLHMDFMLQTRCKKPASDPTHVSTYKTTVITPSQFSRFFGLKKTVLKTAVAFFQGETTQGFRPPPKKEI